MAARVACVARALTVRARAPRLRVSGGNGVGGGVARLVSIARCSPPALAALSPASFRRERKAAGAGTSCVTRNEHRGSAYHRVARVAATPWLTGVACRALASNTPEDEGDDAVANDDDDEDEDDEDDYDEDEDDFDASSVPFHFALGEGDDRVGVDVLVVETHGGPPSTGDGTLATDALAAILEDDARFVIQLLIECGGAPGAEATKVATSAAIGEDTQVLHDLSLRMFPDGPNDVSYVELSVALCTDAHIAELNLEWRGKNQATDVLSFPAETFGDVVVLGDCVISLDTAVRQAMEMRHDVLTETRVLLVHGIAHLAGMDHEEGEAEAAAMSAAETALLRALGRRETAPGDSSSDDTKFKGLIASVTAGERGEAHDFRDDNGETSRAADDEEEDVDDDPVLFSQSLDFSDPGRASRQCDVLALDLDGTLLNNDGVVSPVVAAALREVARKGVVVIVATGKARPAARRALATAGLDGPGLVTGADSIGVFLQGLDVRGPCGVVLTSATLREDVVRDVFMANGERGSGLKQDDTTQTQTSAAVTAFCGEECFTVGTETHALLKELTAKFHEPTSVPWDCVDTLLLAARAARFDDAIPDNDGGADGEPSEKTSGVSKLLLAASTATEIDLLRPGLEALVSGRASVTRSVATMLEVLPLGHDKARGLETLLLRLREGAKGAATGTATTRIVSIGDGENDASMLRGATVGVALGNACAETKRAAEHVLEETNDDDGVAVAIRKFVL